MNWIRHGALADTCCMINHPRSPDGPKWTLLLKPIMLVRLMATGVLMGLANLVPGISGGTMVLVMGLYEEFIGSVAEVTRFRFRKHNLLFLLILVGTAGLAFVTLTGTMGRLVSTHRPIMYALFVGLTLGGAPALYRMVRPPRKSVVIMILVGISVMCIIAFNKEVEPPNSNAVIVQPHYVLDLLAGLLGMSAMVLPGISGAYMLLILGRYEVIFAAVDGVKDALLSGQGLGEAANLHVLAPVAIGAVASIVGLTNLLKWLLNRYAEPTLGFLLGILLGSVVGIPPFGRHTAFVDVIAGLGLIAAGFATTCALSRLSPHTKKRT